MIGRRLGNYEILGKLGEGGMASVYWARDPRIGRDVAIKVLPPWCRDDPSHMGRFKREVRILADLSNPNIVSIFDIGEVDEYTYYAMEYLPAGSLADELARTGRLPFAQVLRVARDMGSALDCIHRAGICHRDIKPHNILRADSGLYKLADFGLGKSEDSDTITRVGEMIGTLRYLPPEGLEGQPMDQTSDLFQLGLVLYEAATGARAYRGASAVEILRAYAKENPIAPSAAMSDLPEAFDNLVFNLIQLKRELRYPNVGDVLADLGRVERGQTVRRRGAGSQPVSAPSSPGTRAAVTTPATLPLRVLLPVGLVVFLVLLLLKPGSNPGPVVSITPTVVADIIQNLSVRVGERKVVVGWTSRTSYKGTVEYGRTGSDIVTVVEEPGATVTHLVTIPELEQFKDWRITVRPPPPAVAESRVVKLVPLKSELIAADAQHGECAARWTTTHATKSLLEVRRYGQPETIEVGESYAKNHDIVCTGIGADIDFQVAATSTNELGESTTLDVHHVVEARIDALGRLPRDEEFPSLLRKLSACARLGGVGPVMAKEILDRLEFRRDARSATPVMGYFLGNPAFPFESRLRLYRCLRMVQVVDALCAASGFSIEGAFRPPYPILFRQLERQSVARDFTMPLPELTAPAGTAPTRTATAVRTSLFKLGPGPWGAVELVMVGRISGPLYLEAVVNNRGTLVMLPPAATSHGDQTIVQRVPVELIRSGDNEIVLKPRPLGGNARDLEQSVLEVHAELLLTRASPGTGRTEIRVRSK